MRYVGLNGSLTNGSATSQSDIDLMVVAARGHIFTVRFLMMAILWLLNLKRNRRDAAGRLCVNYFLSDDNLDIKPRTKKVAGFFKYMVGLADTTVVILTAVEACPTAPRRGSLLSSGKGFSRRSDRLHSGTPRNDICNFHKVILGNNQWMNKYKIPIALLQKKLDASVSPMVQPWADIRCVIEILLLPIADALEILLKKIQVVKILRHPLTASNPDKIIVGDKELMFHPKKSTLKRAKKC